MSIAQEPIDSTRLRDGIMLLRYSSETAALCALEATKLIYTIRGCSAEKLRQVRIGVKAHHTLNSAKDVMFCRALEVVSYEEVRESLASQGVICAERMVRRGGDVVAPTHSFF